MVKQLIILVFIIEICLSCKKDNTYVDLKIESINNITHNSSIFISSISDISSGISIYEKGICFSKTSLPLADDKSPKGIDYDYTNMMFLTGVSGMEPNTVYHTRAYVYTSKGYLYSDTMSFRTQTVETFTDTRDGQKYQIKKYGTQVWMVENLNYKTGNSFYLHNDSSTYAKDFGRLFPYNDALAACPSGWHLPSDAEWIELEVYLGMNAESAQATGTRGDSIGGSMKEPGSRLWYSDNADNATNSSGFTVRPSGSFDFEANHFFNITGSQAVFWSLSTDNEKSYARVFAPHLDGVTRISVNISTRAFSIRCIKDY